MLPRQQGHMELMKMNKYVRPPPGHHTSTRALAQHALPKATRLAATMRLLMNTSPDVQCDANREQSTISDLHLFQTRPNELNIMSIAIELLVLCAPNGHTPKSCTATIAQDHTSEQATT